MSGEQTLVGVELGIVLSMLLVAGVVALADFIARRYDSEKNAWHVPVGPDQPERSTE